jgi:hypothetical protein
MGGQCHAPAALLPGKTRYPLYRWLGLPQGRCERVWKISPPSKFNPRTHQPVGSSYTDWAIPTPTATNLPFIYTEPWVLGVGVVYSDWLRDGRSGDRIPVEARFFAHAQTGPGAHPASSTMSTGSFPGVKRPGRGADRPPSPSAEVENEYSYNSTPSLGHWWPVIGWPLPLLEYLAPEYLGVRTWPFSNHKNRYSFIY